MVEAAILAERSNLQSKKEQDSTLTDFRLNIFGNPSPDVFNLVLNKLQVAPAMLNLNLIRGQLPEAEAIHNVLHTSEISPQQIRHLQCYRKISEAQVLFLIRGLKDRFNPYFLARKMSSSSVIWRSPLGTRCTADACHMDKNDVGYNCIVS